MAILIAGPAAAGMPARLWQGVERVLLTCDLPASVEAAARSALCSEVAEETTRRTGLLVIAGGEADGTDPFSDLRLTVSGTVGRGDEPRRLLVSAQLRRIAGTVPAARSAQVTIVISEEGDIGDAPEVAAQLLDGLLGRRKADRSPLPVRRSD